MERTNNLDTNNVLLIAKKYAQANKIAHIVVATTSGKSGIAAAEVFEDSNINLVVITHSTGFRDDNVQECDENLRNQMEAKGANVFTGTMPFHTINNAIKKKYGYCSVDLAADVLRMFGEGTKVCVELVLMAADAGLIPSKEKVLSIAGTGHGEDTVILIKSANSRRFFSLKVLDVVAKPKEL